MEKKYLCAELFALTMGECTMYRLLMIEDDKGIAEAIKTQAELWGMQVRSMQNFRNVMAQFAEFEPHIVLLSVSDAMI